MGIIVAILLVSFAFPVPSVFTDVPAWLTFAVGPAYIVLALGLGTFWVTRKIVRSLRWSIEERTPDRNDHRNTFMAPARVARMVLLLWGVGTTLLTILYGLHDTDFIPRFLFAVSFPGVLVATGCYMITEFALRPVAAQALEAGPPPNRLTRRDHGPDDARVAARFGGTGARHRGNCDICTVAGEPDGDPTRLRRTEYRRRDARVRRRPDVAAVVADRRRRCGWSGRRSSTSKTAIWIATSWFSTEPSWASYNVDSTRWWRD